MVHSLLLETQRKPPAVSLIELLQGFIGNIVKVFFIIIISQIYEKECLEIGVAA